MLTEEDIKRVTEQCKGTMFEQIGINLLTSDNDFIVKAEMLVDNRTSQPFGFLNGGASLALAENLAGLGSWQLCNKNGEVPFGMQVSGNHISTAPVGDTVTAVATLLHKGKSSHVWNVDISTSDGRLVSTARVINAIRKLRNQ